MNFHQFHYYQPAIPNFGDLLNVWLLDRLFIDAKFRHPIVGVGSILTKEFFQAHNLLNKKVFVMGSGARSISSFHKIDLVEGSFFRGPLTSLLATNSTHHFITDSAYLVRTTDFFKEKIACLSKEHEISIIPYFRSMEYVKWGGLEKEFGVHIIDPTIPKGVEFTMVEIAQSKLIIAEAMHGAIIADALRVPWIRLDFLASNFESKEVSEFKWKDWLYSIAQAENQPIATNIYHPLVGATKNYSLKKVWMTFYKSKNAAQLRTSIDRYTKSAKHAYLSDDKTIKQHDEALIGVVKMIEDDAK